MSAEPGADSGGERRGGPGNDPSTEPVGDRGGEQRLQKLLAQAGVASRRKAEEIIRQGRVTINGRVASLGERADPERDAVKLDGKRLRRPPRHRYLLLNKPDGYVSTLSDPEGRRTVLDLVPERFRRALFPVGRLDFHSEGLLLLTTDGAFAESVSHPRNGCLKTYEVKVKGHPQPAVLDRLRSGLKIAGRRTSPCRIEPMPASRGQRPSRENSWWRVELGEGRSRQIREMFRRIGHPVQRLRRVAIGSLRAQRLPAGGVRELSPQEVARLLAGESRPFGRPRRRQVTGGAGRRQRRK